MFSDTRGDDVSGTDTVLCRNTHTIRGTPENQKKGDSLTLKPCFVLIRKEDFSVYLLLTPRRLEPTLY